jgi:hypothetical protein
MVKTVLSINNAALRINRAGLRGTAGDKSPSPEGELVLLASCDEAAVGSGQVG